jgi:hypothetical protein
MNAGFTGNQKGWTPAQDAAVWVLMRRLREKGVEWLHHGDCVGSDELAHTIWKHLDGKVHLHPPDIRKKRAFCKADLESAPRPYLVRNAEIVADTNILLATPSGPETRRSGTWSTVRMARKAKRPIFIVWPNGTVTREN